MYTTIPAASWSSGFDIHLDDLSLEGSDEGDEDDNLALGKVLVSVSTNFSLKKWLRKCEV